MVKSIEELKDIVTNGMVLKSKTESVIIERYPNNIIKIHKKPVSWKSLQDLLTNGDWQLDIKEEQKELISAEKKSNRGGRRVGAGRKKKAFTEKKEGHLCIFIAGCHRNA